MWNPATTFLKHWNLRGKDFIFSELGKSKPYFKMVAIQSKVLGLLCLLYFLQGIPHGTQLKSLPIYLFDVLKYPVETVTSLSLLMFPWFFLKPFLICFIDIRRYCFLLLCASLAFKMLLNFVLYCLFLNVNNVSVIMLMLFIANCFTVLFDVATDYLIVTSASSSTDFKFFGISNAIQIVAYKFGANFSGLTLQFIEYKNISLLFLLTSGIYCVVFCLALFTFRKYFGLTIFVDNKPSNTDASPNVFNLFQKMFSSKSSRMFIFFILTYKLGEIGATSLLPLCMINSGASRHHVTFLMSVVCEPLSLAGSFLGGLMWSMVNGSVSRLVTMLCLGCFLRALPLLAHAVFFSSANLQGYSFLSCASVALLWFSGGFVSTLAFTLMTLVSCLAGSNYASYCYAIFSSAEVFGKIVFASQVGTLDGFLGTQNVFLLFVCLIFANVAVLYGLQPHLLHEVDKDVNKKVR